MQSNLALITTLYNTKGSDFYKDIYFPLIRYSIMNISNESGDNGRHYDITALQDNIKEKAGITIPLQVLRNSIRLLSQSKSSPLSFYLYSDGNYFRVSGTIGIDGEAVTKETDEVSSQYRRLEIFYQEYLQVEHLSSEKSLLDFFNDNTGDVLGYLKDGDAQAVVDQEYVNVVRFIDWLKQAKPKSYSLVNNILWGSIVAGFLQRSNVDLSINSIQKVDYYLDTSIVMGVLGLNSSENVAYAKDLIRIISESGSTPCVHSITIREIKRIFEQVIAAQGPRRGSSIEQAWLEKEMSLSDIVHIKNNLISLLRNEKINVYPVTDTELDRIEEKYKNNQDVKSLADQRGSLNEDHVREIHDIFMRDYVQKINLSRGGVHIEKQSAYFVTLNSDLISFSNTGIDRTCSVIHSSKVVMNLWLHCSRSENIRQAVLAEVMSRCYALNQTDARQRLRVFYKYFRDCSLDSEDIKNMYGSLINRSANTINSVDKLIENEASDLEEKERISKEIIIGLKAAVYQEKEDRITAIASATQKVKMLEERTESLERALEEGQNSSLEKDEIIQRYEEEQGANKETIARLEAELQTTKAIKDIEKEINQLRERKRSIEQERDKTINYAKFWITIICEVLAILVFVGCLIKVILEWRKGQSVLNIYALFTVSAAVGILAMVKNISNMYILAPGPCKMKVRDEQRRFWEDKHPEYQELLDIIARLEERKRKLEGL